MHRIQKWLQPQTLEEAYSVLTENRNNSLLGGCAFLKMGNKSIPVGIDLSRIGLDQIEERDGWIEIGAMSTLRAIETSPILEGSFSGILPSAMKNIVGVQFRNSVMAGATVFSQYGFSDLITALRVLDTDVELYKGGRMSLDRFLAKKREKDILMKICVRKTEARAAYTSLRNSYSDYPVLNTAVSLTDGKWKMAVGARPMVAMAAIRASEFLNEAVHSEEAIRHAAALASEELTFGTNMRGSADYRRAMSAVLIQRALTEVSLCK